MDYLLSSQFFGVSCLHNVVKRGHFYLAELLLEEMEIDPNLSAEGVGKTALHYATEYNGHNQELFERLVTEYRANINAVDVHSTSVLHLAVYNNKPEQVRFLLANDATAGNGTFFGCPIHIAAFYGRTEMVKAIIERYPAEINRIYQGYSPVQCSIYAESSECFNFLAENCDMNIPILYKVISCMRSDEEALPIIELLLSLGANGNLYHNLHEDLPILAAASKGWESTVTAMLNHTLPIAAVADWTVPTLLSYAQTEEQNVRTESRLELIKRDILRELQNRQLLSASCLIKSVQHSMEHLEWGKYDSFGKLMLSMGMYTSLFPEIDASSIFVRGRISLTAGDLHLAELVEKVLQLLDPKGPRSRGFSELLERSGSSAPSTSRRA